jgi:hypothetical protein
VILEFFLSKGNLDQKAHQSQGVVLFFGKIAMTDAQQNASHDEKCKLTSTNG